MSRFAPHPLHLDLKNRDYRDYKAFLQKAERWSTDQIMDYQVRELARLVRTAATKTKGYGQLYAEYGVADLTITCLEDMKKLPFVTKQLLQKNAADFSLSTNDKDYVTTGGSTGVPFGFFRSPLAFAKELAAKAHQYQRVVWNEGDRQVVFRGLPIDDPERYQFFPEFNELRMSSYHLTPETIDYYLDVITEYQPQWIRCYPSSAQLLAQHIVDQGRRIEGLKGMLCASENLYDHQIELFKRAFSGKIFSHYGHFEQAVLAGFCETEQSYHVLPQYGYAELLDTYDQQINVSDQVGEIVGTSLIMDATLFIRYRTQDYAVYQGDGCEACNRPYQVWKKIEGRLQDWAISATGRPVSMTAFNMHDTIFDRLKQFQLEQHKPGKLVFHFVPKDSLSDMTLAGIRTGVADRLGPGFEIEFKETHEIPVTKRGKHRFLKQHMKLSFGDAGVTGLFESEVPI